MSLMLVRHGQASAGQADYDELSATGRQQSQRLGQWLAETGHGFDAVVIGGMRRHRQTYEALAAAFGMHGSPLPEAVVDPGLDEFDHHAVFAGFLRGQAGPGGVPARPDGDLAALSALVRAALAAWAADRIADVPESWATFGARVRAAGQRLAEGPAQRVLVLTSGGVISRLAQHALGLSDHRTIELNIGLRNSGCCEFRRRPGGLAMASWNALPHLHDARELWTYY